jgi:GNAT superfamily N-acetyltransferase
VSPRRLERLAAHHDLAEFRSGNQVLDSWLRDHSLAAQKMDSARTFVLVEDRRVLGYFSLTMGSVLRADAPPALVRGLPGYPVGMALLARLAVDADHQGQGTGSLLLAEALRKAVAAGEAAAARLVVVDAIDAAAMHFYAHHGFLAVPEQPFRLYRRMKDIRASLDKQPDTGP